jgi:HD-like signal output (HDOD) protein
VLKKSLKELHYEAEKVWSSEEVERAYQGIVQKISEKNLELPVVPAMTCRLNELIRSDSASVHDIARLIMSDQVLTAKILKVANSVFYRSLGRITSLQQAIITMGFRTIESIATMHALSSIPVKDASRVNRVLKHSLYCVLIARRAAADFCLDPEESFVCGLLHDIGKTVLLDIAADYQFPEAAV